MFNKKNTNAMKALLGTFLGLSLTVTPIAAAEVDYQTYYDNSYATVYNHPTDGMIHVVGDNNKELFLSKPVEEKVYTTVYQNIRAIPCINSNSVAVIPPKCELIRMGVSETGWDIIQVEGVNYFMWSEHLTTEKPEGEVSQFLQIPRETRKPILDNNMSYNYQPEQEPVAVSDSNSDSSYSANSFKQAGVVHSDGWRWTWYSQNVLPGGGLNIPGRHVDENGYVCDGDGNICLASGSLSQGTVVSTPFGKNGKVYDSGCNSDTLDVYTDF